MSDLTKVALGTTVGLGSIALMGPSLKLVNQSIKGIGKTTSKSMRMKKTNYRKMNKSIVNTGITTMVGAGLLGAASSMIN